MGNKGKLYIVPTPIGNLKDITLRAIEVLNEVDKILAEDTRTTGKLLSHLKIDTKQQSFHLHNEHKVLERLIIDMQEGSVFALVSDAGTPGISDPGFLLARACIENNIEVETLPGATALIPALVNSGLPCDRFVFEGFIPTKKGKKTKIESWLNEKRSIVFYESPHRIIKTINEMAALLGEKRKVCVCKELTKLHETYWRGTLGEVAGLLKEANTKGEFVVILEGVK